MLLYFDQSMLFGTATALSCSFFDILMPAFTLTDDKGIIWILAGFLFLFNKKTRQCGWMLLFSIALTYLLTDIILKDIVMRERPFEVYGVSKLLIPPPHGFSFPSGHAASSFAALSIIYSANKRMRIPTTIYALFISFSRVYLFVHFPSDVLAGALLELDAHSS